MSFVGITQAYNTTLVNPYSGYTVTITGVKNVNNGIYNGFNGNDTLSMTSMGDVLMLVDSMGTIMVMNVESFNAGADGDIIILADVNVTYGNVTMRGSDGDDILWSNDGNDTLLGSNGDDNIHGGAGNDLIFGDLDNDYLNGGLGNDSLFGGQGDDTFIYSVDAIWSGGMTLAGLGSALPFAAMINLDGMNQSFDNFNGDATDSLEVPTVGYDTLIMTSGDDVLVLSDTVSPGNAAFFPRVSYMEEIDAGDGNDIVDLSGGDHIGTTIHGGIGNDILAGSNHEDTLYGDEGNDRLLGGHGADVLRGGEGDDTYYYNLGDGSDTIEEASGTDSISFGNGIAFSDLDFEVSGLDLIITIGSETITINNHYASDLSGRVEGLVFNDASTFSLIGFVPNDAPVANADTFGGDEDTVISGNVLDNDTDPDNDTLTVTPATITTANGATVVMAANGTFSYTGAANFHGNDSFSYTADDGRGGTSTANVTINVASVNDAPVAGDDAFSGNEDEGISGSLLGNDGDIDGDTLLLAGQTLTTANGGSVTINADGTFSYLGAANFHGTDSFDYTVLDGNGGSDTGTVTLTIGSVNDEPVANDDAFSGDEDTSITGDLLANDTDVDGDALEAIAATLTTVNGGSVTINADGTFSYTGAANFHGADGFDYTVSDGNGGTATAHVDLTVGEVNDGPVANDDSYAGNEDTVITGNVLDNDADADGDVLSVVAGTLTTAQGGSVTLNANGTFSYLGAANFNGNDSFSYTARDASGATSTATVLLSIAAVNDAPVAGDDAFNGLRNGEVTGNVLGNDADIDGDTLSVQAGTFATQNGGTIVLNNDGSFTYTPADNFYGADSFDYTLLDNAGGSDIATMAFSIDLDPSQSIIGTEDGETITGTPGNDEIFGLGGNDVLYGDDGILTGTTMDKAFIDANVMPELIEGVNITNLRPKGDPALGIGEGNLNVDFDATATITFRKGFAGYDNSFGVFGIAADGTIVNASMEWANVKAAGVNVSHDIDLPVGAEGGAYGFFIIADGNNTNGGYSGLNITGDGVISFIYNYGQAGQRAANINDPGNKVSVVYNDGTTVRVLSGDTYLTTERGDSTAINEDGKMHVVSGLLDSNNVRLDVKAADLAAKPASITKNDITVSALSGKLIANGDSIGVKTSASGNTVGTTEALHVGLANGAEKMTISLSDIAGGNTGIDLKIYLNGSTTPVLFEYHTGSVSNGLLDIVLKASDFGGGVITGVDISSISNSSRGTETFYLDNIYAEIPGGTDTNTLRIGFEDLYNTGDADYEDVLFDLDIKPVTTGDIAGGNDVLDGGAGNDTLYGEGGNDILFLGLGADHAFGGAGADVFALNAIDSDVDTIHDFGAGDSINITDVLDSYDPLNDDIADFVRLVQVGSDMQLQINADGDVGGAYLNAALILGGVGTTDVADLITSGALVADHTALA